jgi:hypothetical protein
MFLVLIPKFGCEDSHASHCDTTISTTTTTSLLLMNLNSVTLFHLETLRGVRVVDTIAIVEEAHSSLASTCFLRIRRHDSGHLSRGLDAECGLIVWAGDANLNSLSGGRLSLRSVVVTSCVAALSAAVFTIGNVLSPVVLVVLSASIVVVLIGVVSVDIGLEAVSIVLVWYVIDLYDL